MKTKTTKIMATVMALVAVLSAATLWSAAGNTSNKTFTNKSAPSSGWSTSLNAEQKQDSTSVYFKSTTGNNFSVRVQVHGSASSNGTFTNCTMSGSTSSSSTYVTCAKGVEYLINNLVNEGGYSYATLKFQGVGSSDTIGGVWSPDSVGSFTIAS